MSEVTRCPFCKRDDLEDRGEQTGYFHRHGTDEIYTAPVYRLKCKHCGHTFTAHDEHPNVEVDIEDLRTLYPDDFNDE